MFLFRGLVYGRILSPRLCTLSKSPVFTISDNRFQVRFASPLEWTSQILISCWKSMINRCRRYLFNGVTSFLRLPKATFSQRNFYEQKWRKKNQFIGLNMKRYWEKNYAQFDFDLTLQTKFYRCSNYNKFWKLKRRIRRKRHQLHLAWMECASCSKSFCPARLFVSVFHRLSCIWTEK